jgi:hypothetical protein
MLTEIPIRACEKPIPATIEGLARDGVRRGRSIDSFDFVPSSHEMVYRILDTFERGTFCEWGCGMGVNTGIAALLGFDATGIELNPELAAASRDLLREFALEATILTGDYLEIERAAEIYYVYCWPGQMQEVESRFFAVAPVTSKLLICHGAEDVRCKVKST